MKKHHKPHHDAYAEPGHSHESGHEKHKMVHEVGHKHGEKGHKHPEHHVVAHPEEHAEVKPKIMEPAHHYLQGTAEAEKETRFQDAHPVYVWEPEDKAPAR